MKQFVKTAILTAVLVLFSSCGINKEVHQKALNDLASAQKNHKDEQQVNEKLKKEIETLKKENEGLKKDLLEVINEK
ncbi:MAG TPA: hypothetical protein PKM18_12105, partial [bacterium]|nr:hypothetical protein [bacterium]